ncbi:protein of unknown function [Candidatus Nitrosotalea okcheonensis]|uniref:Uncharacterized protein n=1 Tax=Candidatus Nitrosotalea okcheonensis TaxID=1903276 RepID=A0A2H1FD02_9ARCH|nr:protein of unknown function [Candidatus Nitrosotalea okcheonensis]
MSFSYVSRIKVRFLESAWYEAKSIKEVAAPRYLLDGKVPRQYNPKIEFFSYKAMHETLDSSTT